MDVNPVEMCFNFECAAGYYGNSHTHRTQKCAGACPAGHYCSPGTGATHFPQPTPCPPGYFLDPSAPGTSFYSCTPCAPGQYGPTWARSATSCIACPAGKLSEDLAAWACADCPVGGYCGSTGAASLRQTFTSCPAGKYNPTTGASDVSVCLGCPAGTYNSVPGSSSSTACVVRRARAPRAIAHTFQTLLRTRMPLRLSAACLLRHSAMHIDSGAAGVCRLNPVVAELPAEYIRCKHRHRDLQRMPRRKVSGLGGRDDLCRL